MNYAGRTRGVPLSSGPSVVSGAGLVAESVFWALPLRGCVRTSTPSDWCLDMSMGESGSKGPFSPSHRRME